VTIEAKTTEIDGVHYRCAMMPGWTAMALFWDLVNLLGEPVVVALTRAFQDDANLDQEVDDVAAKALATAAYSLFSKVDAETGTRLMQRALVGVQAEGVGTTDSALVEKFDEHFRGKSWAALRVFLWSLQVNYRDFLDASGLQNLIPLAGEVATKVTLRRTSPATSAESASPGSAATPTV
jgi:hypothetical protein